MDASPSIPEHDTSAVGRRYGAARLRELAPGLLLAAAIACLAMFIQRQSGLAVLSPLIVAVVGGMILANLVPLPAATKPGRDLAVRPVLRAGIVLLGAQLTLSQVASIGLEGIAIIVLTVTATFLVTVRLGRLLGVEPALARMIAAGTSICGASAVVATGAAAGGRGDQVATAIACVTLFGTVAMLGFPLLAGPLGLDGREYAVWAGVAVHEVGQAVAAGFAAGEAEGELATLTKLARVLMLLPVLLAVGFSVRREAQAGGARPPLVPAFMLGFAAMVVLNSAVELPEALKDALRLGATLLMATALAAVGMATDLRLLVRGGVRPLALGFLSFLFVAIFGMMAIRFIM